MNSTNNSIQFALQGIALQSKLCIFAFLQKSFRSSMDFTNEKLLCLYFCFFVPLTLLFSTLTLQVSSKHIEQVIVNSVYLKASY